MSTVDFQSELNPEGGATLSGTGSSSTSTTRRYDSTSRIYYDDQNWNEYDNYWSRILYDYIRHGKFEDQISQSASFDAAREQPLIVNPATRSGDTEVQVSGLYIAGSGSGSGGSLSDRFDNSRLQTTTSAVTKYTHFMTEPYSLVEGWLDGVVDDPLPDYYPPLPEDYVYPIIADEGSGAWLAWIAGHKGDGFDRGANFTSGLGDNLSMGLSIVIRDKIMGFNTVDYDSSEYIWGDRAGTAISIATGGAAVGKGLYKLGTAVDDLGRCANPVARVVLGGCFVAGTLVTLSDLPASESLEANLWGNDEWLNEIAGESDQTASVAVVKRLLTPIEQVPLGARVPTKNPRPWEFDASLPEPEQDSWVKLSITVERNDGGIIDAELLRPRSWVRAHGIQSGQFLPLNIAELQVAGHALVTAIEPCPVIAGGEGSVVTARFVTRQVEEIARIEVLGADGRVETIEGTTVHPIWSLDRHDWIPLGELAEGEQLLGSTGPAIILSHSILHRAFPSTISKSTASMCMRLVS